MLPALASMLGRGRDVARLAGMARAEQRDLRRREKAKRRMPSAATNGIAWNGFSALRVIVRKPGSPAANSKRPVAIDDGDRSHVHAVDRVAAHDDDERRVAAARWRGAAAADDGVDGSDMDRRKAKPYYRPLRDRCG